MFEPLPVVAFGMIFPVMTAPTFSAIESRHGCHLGHVEQSAQFPRFQQVGVESFPLVFNGNAPIPLLQLYNFGNRLLDTCFLAEDCLLYTSDAADE